MSKVDFDLNELRKDPKIPNYIKTLMIEAVTDIRLLEKGIAGKIELAYWRGKQGKKQ